jgi:hypothetical protein
MPRKAITPKLKVNKMTEQESVIESIPEQSPEQSPEQNDEPLIESVVKKARAPNPWVLHCKETRAANEGMSYKESMVLAKETYKK